MQSVIHRRKSRKDDIFEKYGTPKIRMLSMRLSASATKPACLEIQSGLAINRRQYSWDNGFFEHRVIAYL